MTKAILAYRESDMLRSSVPLVCEALGELGYEVESLTFPQGTKINEIIEVIKVRTDFETLATSMVSDDTLTRSLVVALSDKGMISDDKAHQLYKTCRPLGLKGIGATSLDGIFSKAYEEVVAGEGAYWGTPGGCDPDDIEPFGITLTGLVKHLIRVKGIPEKVYITKDHIADHEPLKTLYAKSGGAMSYDGFSATLSEEKFTPIYTMIKDALVDGGIPAEKIEPIDYFRAGQPDAWVFIDRHALPHGEGSCGRREIPYTFRFPLGELAHQLKEYLPTYDESTLGETVKRIVKRNFAME